ncbi:alpha/beta hydrolase [Winogradskyella sp. DF17]|uniref:Alpha/beta hydrolase n=1 Tax=Winogradskyella pelagia TaxID=2819984 RepID=A0ABS3SZA6_9FLAO|nr:alpha/beta hydrolase [Winogradskyella sp. DF17]MBO3115374.1 alpha/beta hydrolase [Winogradskyella sp. DF17]
MFIDYNSSKVHFEVDGNGPALLLLHGFMEELSMWDCFIKGLSQKCKVIRIDLLGHGETDCIDEVHSMETMAEVVYAVLQSLSIKTIKVVGHSMGGYVALALAELYPQLISDLVLLNSTFIADFKERKELRAKANLQAKESKESYEKLLRLSFTNLFAPESKKTYSEEYKNSLNKALQTSICAYTAAMEGMRLRPNRHNILKKIPNRKVVIAGKKDELINLELLRKKTDNSPIELIEFSEGHMSHIENKSELSYFLNRFIEN